MSEDEKEFRRAVILVWEPVRYLMRKQRECLFKKKRLTKLERENIRRFEKVLHEWDARDRN